MLALRCSLEEKKLATKLIELPQRTLNDGDVLIRVEYSSLNYKDALGVTGKGSIFKTLPITPGIDAAGTIETTKSSKFKVGDPVLITGGGLGETHDGGYSTLLVEHESNIVLRDKNLSAKEAMTYGTAGFTAALCAERMLRNGQTPEMGPLLVTGASGGVGQFAISFFTKLGFEVHALTGKQEMAPELIQLGAKKVIHESELNLGSRPLETIRFGGAIDNLGGEALAKIMAHTQLWGNIACVGLAASYELHTSVMPLILRGVSLIGISSNNTPRPLRLKIWEKLSNQYKTTKLQNFISKEISLNEVLETANLMLERKTHGRVLVKI